MSSADARLLAASSPAGLAHVCSRGRWIPYEHLIVLNDHLLRVAVGEIDRLMVWMPPRHGKSELTSRWLPAWWLGTWPNKQVMLASYEATFARSWGRKAREALAGHGAWAFGVTVSTEPRAADWWQVAGRDGVMVTAGIGGALTGKGADLLLIDDPIKNAEQAASQTIRDKHYDWWQSTASTRLQPGGAVVVIQTRWHEDDLSGRLLAEEPGRWTVLNLAALAEPGDALGRREGQPLCPELYDREALEQIRRQVGSYFWTAMYQGRPAPLAGFLFKREHFRSFTEEQIGAARFWVLHTPDGPKRYDRGVCSIFQTVDVAASEKTTADFTVVGTFARTPGGELLVLDVQRRRFELQDTTGFIRSCNDTWDQCPLWVEKFGHGLGPFQWLRRNGYGVRELKADTDKIRRAQHAIAVYERGDCYHPRAASWLGELEQELLSFPNAAHDDQVDVVAYAARLLPSIGGEQRMPERTGRTITGGLLNQQF